MQENRIIFHVDLDAFFASCEERENPRFRGKAIVVGADPLEGKGRGVVSTANYAARKFGIHSALPISQAWRLCPNAVFLPVNSSLYSRTSRSVMKILENTAQQYNGKFEQVGIDEAYLDVTGSVPVTLAKDIKEKIYIQERITASVGVGPNKLVAKIASDFQKPDGLTIVEAQEVQKFLDPLPIRKLPGIGPKTEAELKKLYVGYRKPHIIQTVRDLRKIPQSLLYEEFGQNGISLYERACGIDRGRVEKKSEAKSISEEHTFAQDTDSAQEILPVLFSLAQNVLQTATSDGHQKFRTITIRIRYAGFDTHTKAQSGNYDAHKTEEIEKIALKLFWPFLSSNKKIRLIGFRVSSFV